MRIAITNWTDRLAGGAETYLGSIAQEFLRSEHEVSLWHEVSEPADRPALPISQNLESWNASTLGFSESLNRLTKWGPDVIYCQGMLDPAHESAMQKIAPTVFFAHNFHGTCISGAKATAFPVIQPCRRQFDASCLLRYLPLRCGGLNPVTMMRQYRLNRNRLRVLASYSQVITHSRWMSEEYRNHGIPCRTVRFFAPKPQFEIPPARKDSSEWQLLMMGRMVDSKGGAVLLESVQQVATKIGKPIHLTMAGDGPSRPRWEEKSRELTNQFGALRISFPGWLDKALLHQKLAQADLLMMPSLWPEPFGLAGLEAASMGVPAVGFALGGIPDWLTEGVNGALASADPPSANEFASAILRCLRSNAHLSLLRQGALETARRMGMANHYEDLMRVFENVIGPRDRAIA